jgi:hypothetical protein
MMNLFDFQMLEKLHSFMSLGKIPYFFDDQCNLLWDMGMNKKRIVSAHLANAIQRQGIQMWSKL